MKLGAHQRVINISDDYAPFHFKRLSPEEKLLRAILERAMLDLYMYARNRPIQGKKPRKSRGRPRLSNPDSFASDRTNRDFFARLLRWLFRERGDDNSVLSLRWVVESLGFDGNTAIKKIRQYGLKVIKGEAVPSIYRPNGTYKRLRT